MRTAYVVLRVLNGGGFSVHCVFASLAGAEQYIRKNVGMCRWRIEQFAVQE